MSTHSSAKPGFFISHTFSRAWKVFQKSWLTVMLLIALPMVIAIAFNVGVLYMGEQTLTSGPMIALVLGYFALQLIVSMGVTKGMLKLVRSQEISPEIFTSVMPNVLNYIVVSFLYLVIVLVGILLLIVPGVIWSIKYICAPYLVIDKGLSPMAALKMSARMTSGVKWDLIAFYYSVVILAYLGLLALVVGIFVTIPVASLACFIVYDQLYERANSTAATD